MNGIRERLREKFKRFPDPEEMEFKMNCDKGFGGYKKMLATVKVEKEVLQVSSDDDSMVSESETHPSQHSNSDEGHGGPQKYQRTHTNKVVFF